MWQAEADTELTLSASPTTAVGQKALALAKRRYSTVSCCHRVYGFLEGHAFLFWTTFENTYQLKTHLTEELKGISNQKLNDLVPSYFRTGT